MNGENNGKPYEQMDDLGVPLFLETPIYIYIIFLYQNISDGYIIYEYYLYDIAIDVYWLMDAIR